MGYIYLIQLASFVNEGINIYKVGMTEQYNLNNRLRSYDRGYLNVYSLNVDDPIKLEKDILKIFNDKFIRYNDGDYKQTKEYFKGDKSSMIKVINDVCLPKIDKEKEKAVGWGWKLLGY